VNTTENWVRQGLLVELKHLPNWVTSHAQHPTVIDHPTNPELVRMYFASRASKNQSFMLFADINLKSKEVVHISPSPIISLGDSGTFDERGSMPSCVVKKGGEYLMYYFGINQDIDLPFRNSIGLAKSSDGCFFERVYQGPVIDRQPHIPLYASCPWYVDGKKPEIYFLSGIKWELEYKNDYKKWRSYYHIKRARWEHQHWVVEPSPVLEVIDGECAVARPQIVDVKKTRKMYFCSRWDHYYLGVAFVQENGLFVRGKIVLEGDSDWDNEMQAYPNYYKAQDGTEYMFYNGNNFGKAGIGFAIKK
jgi:hypothetical protein